MDIRNFPPYGDFPDLWLSRPCGSIADFLRGSNRARIFLDLEKSMENQLFATVTSANFAIDYDWYEKAKKSDGDKLAPFWRVSRNFLRLLYRMIKILVDCCRYCCGLFIVLVTFVMGNCLFAFCVICITVLIKNIIGALQFAHIWYHFGEYHLYVDSP